MIAAIYARKSTEQAGLADEEKSVARQLAHARAYAVKRGWRVSQDHVYVDDGISGAEFVKRPGFVRLMNALTPRPPFQVLIMSEESRLGREQIETAYALKQIIDARVRVFFYLEDRERTLDSAMDKVMLSLTNFAAEMERERARQRTYEAVRAKATAGYVAGGLCYGYTNQEILGPVGADGQRRRQHVVRTIHPAQAAVLRRIFTMAADGDGLVRIAKTLNAEAVPPPRRTGHPGPGWSPSAIRPMLRRELYVGRIVWNKMRRVDRGGTRKKVPRPTSEWLTVEAPALRIIDAQLWRAVQTRLTEKQDTYKRVAGGRLWGRPEATQDSPYLLTGFGRCALCGGSLYVRRRTSRGHAQTYYGCAYRHQRGPSACTNTLTVPMGAANAAFLSTLKADVLSQRIARQVVARAIELAIQDTDTEAPATRRRRLEEDLRRVEREIQRYTDAIGQGEPLPSLLDALRTRERQRAEIQAQLEQGERLVVLARRPKALERELMTALADWQGLLERQPREARPLLRTLLAGRVLFTPHEDTEGGYYEFASQASWGKLLAGVVGASSVVPPG